MGSVEVFRWEVDAESCFLAAMATHRRPLVELLRALTPPVAWQFALRRLVVGNIEGADCYRPMYLPWLEPTFLDLYDEISPHTVVSADRCYYLATIARQVSAVEGAFAEAGAYRGGTGRLIRGEIERSGAQRAFFVFDSFEGMKTVDPKMDRHRRGDFADTSLEAVRRVIGEDPWIQYRKGWIPETFRGLEDQRFAFAHIDVDLYMSVRDCCDFIYPRLNPGGAMVFDGGEMAFGVDGTPAARMFFMRREQVEVFDTWNSTGLRGSGSNDYAVDDLFVPEHHSFDFYERKSGTGKLAEPETLARVMPAIPLGATRAALDHVRALAAGKVVAATGQKWADNYRHPDPDPVVAHARFSGVPPGDRAAV